MQSKIYTAICGEKEYIINLVQQLIRIPSETGKEEKIINKLEEVLKDYGFDEVFIDGMGNLIGKMGSGKKVLAIDGHVDTVAIGNKEKWIHDPLGAEIKNEKIYGRGSCDQKGGVAAALYACKLLKQIGIPKDLTIYFVASVFEEIFEGKNWQHIINKVGIKPDAVLLTEPSNVKIIIGHRGRIDLQIEVEGISSHGADPDLGENAIYKMAPIISDIEKMHKELPTDPIFGKSTITITNIKSSTVSLNAVADNCTIHVDRRLGSGETKESVLNELNKLPSIKNTQAKVTVVKFDAKSYKDYPFNIEGYYPSWQMDEKHPLVEAAEDAFREQFQKMPQIGYWRFSTNGVATKGLFDIPTIGYGPGNEKLAHTTDEYLEINELLSATEFYLSFMFKYAEK